MTLVSRFAVASVVSLTCFSALALSLKPNVVYGNDDRKDFYQETNLHYLELSDSTVALVETNHISPFQKVLKLTTSSYKDDYGLCESEPFANQQTGAFCSGFLVAPDLIATAGHCAEAVACKDMSFVFGYKMDSENSDPSMMAPSQVYKCAEVIASEVTRNQDYALIRLDRLVADHAILSLMKEDIQEKSDLVMMGHPAGLPLKIAAGAQVRSVQTGYFSANTDSFGGNSGSAVFNSDGEVAGILVRGEQDFAYDSENSCVRSNVCLDDGCRGEDVTFISYIRQALSTLVH